MAGPQPTVPETDTLSPRVIRDLHADLVRQKRRSLIQASPLLLLAAFAWLAAITDPARFAGLFFLVFLVFAGIGGIAYEWITLRRVDPMVLYEREQRAAETRKAEQVDHMLKTAAIRPYASLVGVGVLIALTLIQFNSGSLAKTVAAAGLVKPAVAAGEWWRLLTASYLHGSGLHLISNVGALGTIGELIETYDRRLRIPLVYLCAVIGGSVMSTLASPRPAIGASGGVLGLAAYLLVVAGRQSGDTPAWVRRQMLKILAMTALLGIVAYAFIDNAAHAGGALTGAAIGYFTISRDSDASRITLDSAGWAAAAILWAGAVFTVLRLTG